MERLDFEGRKAFVREIDCDYYTDAITYTRVTILDTFAEDAAAGSHGEVHVVSRVVGFKKIKFYTNENVGSGELDLPEQQMHTTSYWLTIPAEIMAMLPYASDDRRDGVVGLAFAMRQVAQLLLMCDRHDIGISIDTGEPAEPTGRRGSRRPELAGDKSPRLFIYDNYPGGIGFSEPLFRMHDELLTGTRRSDCRVRVRERMPGLRRTGWRHRSAGKERGACASSICCWRARLERGQAGRGPVRVSTLADRLRGVVNGARGPVGSAGPDAIEEGAP